MHFNIAHVVVKYLSFIKKIIHCGVEIHKPIGTEMQFDFSSLLSMGRVTYKYMRVIRGNGKGKTCPHPASLPFLTSCTITWHKNLIKMMSIKLEQHHTLKVLILDIYIITKIQLVSS